MVTDQVLTLVCAFYIIMGLAYIFENIYLCLTTQPNYTQVATKDELMRAGGS